MTLRPVIYRSAASLRLPKPVPGVRKDFVDHVRKALNTRKALNKCVMRFNRTCSKSARRGAAPLERCSGPFHGPKVSQVLENQ
jgi:hypothetical protein